MFFLKLITMVCFIFIYSFGVHPKEEDLKIILIIMAIITFAYENTCNIERAILVDF